MIEIRQTLRQLLRAPGFTLTTMLTLAIGLGATIAIFAVVNGVLIKSLPFADAGRLVSLTHRSQQLGATENLPASSAIYFTYRDHNRAFESVALWQADAASVTAPGDSEEVRAMLVTFELLPMLGVVPALGRAFVQTDDQPDSAPTVMLSHAFWQRRFGGAENALGAQLVVDGVAHTIIGVLPQDFRFLRRPADVLLPMRPVPALSFVGPLGENGIARLRAGVTLEEANADVGRMIPIVAETFPPVPGMDPQALRNLRLLPDVKPLKEAFVGDLEDVLWVLLGTIVMLLAIACANVANLHLVRTEGRSRELAIQAALGATRAGLALGVVRESMLLGLAAGALGLAFATLALPALLATAADELPSVITITIDGTVLAFALAASLASGAFFGIAPALRYSGSRLAGMLTSAGRGHSMSRDRHRVHHGLIAAQVAFALILLVASGLVARTFQSLLDVEPGFVAPDAVQTVSVSLPEGAVPDFPRAVRMFHRMQDAIGSLAGVESVGFASRVPLGGQG
ncbi:MAG: FtsX-like permease family protein, partial [Candidatus Cloacimonetes bacterium]|nr:FtsX-like permease family protein [Candidatus Cloacimonadota bacterium]